jgi:hypothetical protein
MVFNRLEVLEYSHTDKYRNIHWKVKCNCEKQTVFTIKSYSLTSGHTKSCGCIQKETTIKNQKKYNAYDLSSDYGVGYDYKNNIFTFDLEDYDKIKNHCWHKNKRGYIVTSLNTELDDVRQTIRIHRVIMGVEDPEIEVDHIDRDKSNNRKYNLRLVDHRQNNVNKNPNYNNSSGCQGVYYNLKLNKWHSQIYYQNKKIHLGYFDNLDDAIITRLEYEIKIENFNNSHLYKKFGYDVQIINE